MEQQKEAKVQIKLLIDYAGAGKRGDTIMVSPIRAERWCREGIAVLPNEKKPAAKKAAS